MVGSQKAEPGMGRVGLKRLLDINELEELRNDAYFNLKIAKDRLKKWHDQLIAAKTSNKETKCYFMTPSSTSFRVSSSQDGLDHSSSIKSISMDQWTCLIPRTPECSRLMGKD